MGPLCALPVGRIQGHPALLFSALGDNHHPCWMGPPGSLPLLEKDGFSSFSKPRACWGHPLPTGSLLSRVTAWPWLCKQYLLTLCPIALTSVLCFCHCCSAMFDYTFPVTFSGLYFRLLGPWSSARREVYQRSSRSLTPATGWTESLGV